MTISVEELLERYDAFLIDAYGVLVTTAGVVPGGPAFVEALEEAGRPWCIVTNDASKSEDRSARRYGDALGRAIDPERIVTAGSVLTRWVEEGGLGGEPASVLGPADSSAYAERAGLTLVEPEEASVFVVGDEAGFDFLPMMDRALSAIIHRREAGDLVHLVCPNGDMIYPKGDGGFGLAAGSMASMLEGGLAARFPDDGLEFERLGKPHPTMFREAMERMQQPGDTRWVLIGDTPATDIAGANGVGIDSVLFGSARPHPKKREEAPTWRLLSW